MRRFSRGLCSIRCGELPPAVKQGGGVTSHVSPEHALSGKVLISLPMSESLLSPPTGGVAVVRCAVRQPAGCTNSGEEDAEDVVVDGRLAGLTSRPASESSAVRDQAA